MRKTYTRRKKKKQMELKTKLLNNLGFIFQTANDFVLYFQCMMLLLNRFAIESIQFYQTFYLFHLELYLVMMVD